VLSTVQTVPAGLYVGSVSNYRGAGVAPLTRFTLQLNEPVPVGSVVAPISARWVDNRGCIKTTGIHGGTGHGPYIIFQNFTCNGEDFFLRFISVNGNVYSGDCAAGASNCRFQMVRQ
jgi:hypothetical protein